MKSVKYLRIHVSFFLFLLCLLHLSACVCDISMFSSFVIYSVILLNNLRIALGGI